MFIVEIIHYIKATISYSSYSGKYDVIKKRNRIKCLSSSVASSRFSVKRLPNTWFLLLNRTKCFIKEDNTSLNAI